VKMVDGAMTGKMPTLVCAWRLRDSHTSRHEADMETARKDFVFVVHTRRVCTKVILV
jgi:hypothetical protein